MGAPNRLRAEHFAQLEAFDLTWGHLTILVGPQATGKSLVAQLWKWVLDKTFVYDVLKDYGFILDPHQPDFAPTFADAYFGEGLGRAAWRPQTRVWLQHEPWTPRVRPHHYWSLEQVLYIPAHRALCLLDSRPRPFRDFSAADPFVLKHFSEQMRKSLEPALGQGVKLEAPDASQPAWLTAIWRQLYPDAAGIRLQVRQQWRIVQHLHGHAAPLPLMTWSSGQREFFPLLWAAQTTLMDTATPQAYSWIVIEEPEMGLHTAALRAFLMLVAHWLTRGYRVILTTHAAQIVEFAWVLRQAQRVHKATPTAAAVLKRYLDLPEATWRALLGREVRVYGFKRQGQKVHLKDISPLDAWSEDADEADWGGLTESATRAHEVVGQLTAWQEAVEP